MSTTTRDPAWLEHLASMVQDRLVGVDELGLRIGWAGLYEVTPDHNALIGRADEVEGFVYATGFSGHGFLMGPAVGEVVRDLVTGRAPGGRRGRAVGDPVRVKRRATGAPHRLSPAEESRTPREESLTPNEESRRAASVTHQRAYVTRQRVARWPGPGSNRRPTAFQAVARTN